MCGIVGREAEATVGAGKRYGAFYAYLIFSPEIKLGGYVASCKRVLLITDRQQALALPVLLSLLWIPFQMFK